MTQPNAPYPTFPRVVWADEVPRTHGSGTYYRLVERYADHFEWERQAGTDAMHQGRWEPLEAVPTQVVGYYMHHLSNPDTCECSTHIMARLKNVV